MTHDTAVMCREPKVRETQVGEQLTILAGNDEGLFKALCELENRLRPLLPSEPDCDPKPEPAEPSICPLAERMRTNNKSIASAIRRLSTITNRIEL